VFGDGTHERDFIHVDDIVRSLEQAAENELAGVYNLGTRQAHSINEVIDTLGEAFDTKVEPTYIDNPIPDHMFIERVVSDCLILSADYSLG
jgi:UDP-glucose 4-epimerase